MRAPRFILASASPRRAALLRARGADFTALPARVAEIDPAAFPQLSPVELAAVNAFRKAAAIAPRHPGCWVAGCDTVVALGATTFGKPASEAEARAMLRALSGRVHAVVSAVAIMRAGAPRPRIHCFHETTLVRFRTLSRPRIDAYLRRVHVLDKAGAYALQEGGARIIRAICGPADNVVGLPVDRLLAELARLAAGDAAP